MSERQVLNKKNLGITDGLPLQASTGGIDELRERHTATDGHRGDQATETRLLSLR